MTGASGALLATAEVGTGSVKDRKIITQIDLEEEDADANVHAGENSTRAICLARLPACRSLTLTYPIDDFNHSNQACGCSSRASW
jgi:hypothetical protein